MKKTRFIQEALKEHRAGTLHKQLGVPLDKRIPRTLLSTIVKAHAGDTVKNPTSVGKKRIKVTRLVERRAILATTLRKFHKR